MLALVCPSFLHDLRRHSLRSSDVRPGFLVSALSHSGGVTVLEAALRCADLV